MSNIPRIVFSDLSNSKPKTFQSKIFNQVSSNIKGRLNETPYNPKLQENAFSDRKEKILFESISKPNDEINDQTTKTEIQFKFGESYDPSKDVII